MNLLLDAPSQFTFKNSEQCYSIRVLVPDDAHALYEAAAETVNELRRFSTWPHSELSIESQGQWIKLCQSQYREGQRIAYGVFTDDRLVMYIALTYCPTNDPLTTEIGYWVRKAYQRRGLATNMLRVFAVFVFDRLGFGCLQAGCNIKNSASRRLLEKSGFILEEERLDYYDAPSSELIANGFETCRTCAIYKLMSGSASEEPWYSSIKQRISF
jgi:RimJ/RimL family protein N-acetyltransferase